MWGFPWCAIADTSPAVLFPTCIHCVAYMSDVHTTAIVHVLQELLLLHDHHHLHHHLLLSSTHTPKRALQSSQRACKDDLGVRTGLLTKRNTTKRPPLSSMRTSSLWNEVTAQKKTICRRSPLHAHARVLRQPAGVQRRSWCQHRPSHRVRSNRTAACELSAMKGDAKAPEPASNKSAPRAGAAARPISCT